MKLKSTKDATNKQVERILRDIERARDIKREVKKKKSKKGASKVSFDNQKKGDSTIYHPNKKNNDYRN